MHRMALELRSCFTLFEYICKSTAGGGSGHEPAHGGYVGKGMLAAAVVGYVFASPPAEAILACLKAVTGAAGTLVVIMNYTGGSSFAC